MSFFNDFLTFRKNFDQIHNYDLDAAIQVDSDTLDFEDALYDTFVSARSDVSGLEIFVSVGKSYDDVAAEAIIVRTLR